MIRWCAYCQSYQGESAPFDQYAFTHTICPSCIARGAFDDGALGARIAPIVDFYRKVARVATTGNPSAEALLDEGLALGVTPFDLLVGVIQPALHEVGYRWERGEVTYQDEHRLTAVCSAMLDGLEQRMPAIAALRSAARRDVVLVGLPSNTHAVGLRIVELFLLVNGVRVLRVEARSVDQVVETLREARPALVGIGVTMPEQVDEAVAVADRISDELGPVPPRVILGGAAFRRDAPRPALAHATLCDDFRSMLEMLRTPAGGANTAFSAGS